jgi:DHA3 family macrolide efflux protein-like MFS transporter
MQESVRTATAPTWGGAQLARSGWRARFFTIWSGQAFSLVGSSLARFAIIWWLTEQTGSATVLAAASLVTMLPLIVLGPFVGALVDRWSRRRVMIVADAAIALLSALLAYLYWADVVQIWHVPALLLLRALGSVFHESAMRASTSLMAPEDQLTRIGGMNETLRGAINIVAPPLGALLVALLPMHGILALDVATASVAVVPLLFVSIPQPEAQAGRGGRTLLGDMAEGFRTIWHRRELGLTFVVLASVSFFTAPALTLLPLMVTQHFGGGVAELGWLNSVYGFGFVTGGLVLSLWGGFKRQAATALVGLMGVGACTLVFGLVPANAFWLALVVMFLRMTMSPIVRGPIMAMFQARIPPEMQGRVLTLLISGVSAVAPLGLAIGGPLADALGARVLFILAGAGCLLIAAAWAVTLKLANRRSRFPRE